MKDTDTPPPPLAVPREDLASDGVAPVESPPVRKRKLRDILWPVALSLVVLLVILVVTFEEGVTTQAIRSFRPLVFLLGVVLLGVQQLLGALRLRFISHGVLSFRPALRAQITWEFFSAITPSAMGGGPFASVLIARENDLGYGRVLSWSFFVTLLDLLWASIAIGLLFIAAIWLPIFPTVFGVASIGPVALYLLGLLAWTAFFAYATLMRPAIIKTAADWIVRFKWLRRLKGFVDAEATMLKRQARILRGQRPEFYLAGLVLTASIWIVRYGIALCVALSLIPDAALPDFRWALYIFRTAALLLVGIVMPTPGGSGGIEGLFLLFLAPLLSRGLTGPVVLGWRAITYYLMLVVGSFVAGGALQSFFSRPQKSAPAN